MNYTKGEWKANKSSVECDGWPIATTWPDTRIPSDVSLERMKANAHLIAAAPLMAGQLEIGITALQAALTQLGNGWVTEATDYIKGVIVGNQMALAKAEGGK